MDSSNPQCGPPASLRSNLKRKAKTLALDKLNSKKPKFIDTYIHQSFSLPDSIVHYFAKNPSASEVYQKMIQSCKYFFVKNKILVISRLLNYGDHWRINNKRKPFDFAKVGCKFWISNELQVGPKDLDKQLNLNILSSIIPKLYRCEAVIITLCNQVISLHDLTSLVSSAETIVLNCVTVRHDDGSKIPAEKIVEVAVKSEMISLYEPTITPETFEELIKIPHFLKLDNFHMILIPEVFDVEAFYGYMKKNKSTKFMLLFDESISEAFKNRLEEMVGEILATKVFDYKPPLLLFPGLAREKYRKLDRLYCRH